VHVSKDFKSSSSKGMAFVQFVDSDTAESALRALDGKTFQGRLLHILPASDKKTNQLDDFTLSKLPLKKQKAIKQKQDAANSSFSWNSLYMNPDAVLSSVADRLGVSKSQVLDPTSSDAAVKQAMAETNTIKDTKSYLQNHGIKIEAFKNNSRDDRTILLKNFSFGTTSDDLRGLLDPFGSITRLILPPTGTMAIAQFEDAQMTAKALKHLAYRNFKGSVLFLEKAPQGIFDVPEAVRELQEDLTSTANAKVVAIPTFDTPDRASATVFVRNLNFATTNSRLTEIFKPLPGFLKAAIKTRTDPQRPGEILSMGFGFVEFTSKDRAAAAIAAMNGSRLDGHELLVKASTKVWDAAEETRSADKAKKTEKKTKIIIKNLPFEASKKDIKALFGAYGQLRTVRVPKKFDQSARGFAFADFVTAKEAENAMEALSNTHLLGRRLVLDFAAGEAIDPEGEIQALERKMGQQNEMVQLSQITGSARRKFNVEARDGDEQL
jgi:multiple RNA-binding domain-containing protein 1